MSLPPFWNAVLALCSGAAALAGVSHLSATATGTALAWVAADRSEGGVAPLTMRGVEARFAQVGREPVRLRAAGLRLAPTRFGPFAVNTSRSIELDDVALRLGPDGADAAVVLARGGSLRRDGFELRGDVRARRGERLLRAGRVAWKRGEERLRFESPRTITDFGLEPVSPVPPSPPVSSQGSKNDEHRVEGS